MQKALLGTGRQCWTPAWLNHKQDIDNELHEYYTD